MGIIGGDFQALAADNKREIFQPNQMGLKRALKRRDAHFWIFALVLEEAVKEDKSSLGVEEPSEPKLFAPTKSMPKTPQSWNDFTFVLKRDKTNARDSDSAVLPHKISKILTAYFEVCGFANFKIMSCEDNDYYYVTIRCLEGFCFGSVLATNVGELVFIPQDSYCGKSGMLNRNGTYGKYDVAFYRGGTFNGIVPNKTFEVYERGLWYKCAIVPDPNNNPKLTHFNAHPDFYIGSIARIKEEWI